MDRDRWAAVERILDGALDRPESERSDFVREATGDDRELETEVLELLKACEESGDLLSEPPPLVAREVWEEAPSQEDEFHPGDQVGSYRITRLLGRGGMGAVYLAERADGFFEKEVALKVIRRAGTSEETLARFEAERQILARLEHPNIVGILDGGTTEEGVPYVVMELALGDPIDQFCERLKLPVAKRLELFKSVCAAVQYAHRNLVVHRDLKPSNVLVTPEGAVRLLDFGIAAVLEGEATPDSSTDESPQRLTPEYAAPEQLLGEPTTVATDVYSLGALLYELLCGHRPYTLKDRSVQGIIDVVCEEVPKPPSERVAASDIRRSKLEGDLDAIALKALEKNPDQRYGSATEFAEDLRRHAEYRPVRARPATRWYRTGKFLTRYRRQVTAVSAALFLLGTGVVGTTVQWRTAERERALREREAERAGLAESMLLSTFAELGEGNRGARPIAPGEFVTVARGNLARLTASPRLSAGLRNKLGTISLNLSQFDAADTLFVEALDELENMEGAELERAEALTGLGYRVLRGSMRGDSAVAYFREALALRRSALPPSDTAITNSMIDLGFSLYADDQLDESLELLHDALSRSGPQLQRARGLEFLTNALMSQVRQLTAEGRHEEAEDPLNEAEQVALESLQILRRNGAHQRLQYGNLLLSLAEVRAGHQDSYAAEEAATEALRTYDAVAGPVSARTGMAWVSIGSARQQRGDLQGAEEAMRNGIEIFASSAPTLLPPASMNLAQVLVELGRYDEAEPLLLAVLDANPIRPLAERTRVMESLEGLYTTWGREELAADMRERRQALSAAASP